VAELLRPKPDQKMEKGSRIVEWQREQTRDARAPLFVLLAAAGLLLVIACVNIATLLLGEAATREHEMAARRPLGPEPGRIVRQLLTESVVLGPAGLTLGALFSWWGTRALVALAPAKIPGLSDVRVDVRVFGASLAAALTTGLLFGLAPALSLSNAAPAMLLR